MNTSGSCRKSKVGIWKCLPRLSQRTNWWRTWWPSSRAWRRVSTASAVLNAKQRVSGPVLNASCRKEAPAADRAGRRNRTGPERSASDGLPTARGRGAVRLQLGRADQTGALPSDGHESHCPRTPPSTPCAEEDRRALEVSGEQMGAARSPGNLDAAFTPFFGRCALKKQGQGKGKLGYPQVKAKKKGLGSFRL